MNFSEYINYDALGLVNLIRKKEITPSEIIDISLNAIEKINPKNNSILAINSLNNITLQHQDLKLTEVNVDDLIIQLESNFSNSEENIVLTLHLNKHLKFQEYITIKSKLQNLNFETVVIDNNEYIF